MFSVLTRRGHKRENTIKKGSYKKKKEIGKEGSGK